MWILPTSAYRNVPTEAVKVLAGIPPIILMADKTVKIYIKGHQYKGETTMGSEMDTHEGWVKIFVPILPPPNRQKEHTDLLVLSKSKR